MFSAFIGSVFAFFLGGGGSRFFGVFRVLGGVFALCGYFSRVTRKRNSPPPPSFFFVVELSKTGDHRRSAFETDGAPLQVPNAYFPSGPEPRGATRATQETQGHLFVSVDFCRFLLVSVGLNLVLVSLVSLGSRARRTRAIKRTHRLEGAVFSLSHAPACASSFQAAERDVRPWVRVPSNWTVRGNN